MGFAAEEEDGVLVTWAEINGFTVRKLRFPDDYVRQAIEPERSYLALVLEHREVVPPGSMLLDGR